MIVVPSKVAPVLPKVLTWPSAFKNKKNPQLVAFNAPGKMPRVHSKRVLSTVERNFALKRPLEEILIASARERAQTRRAGYTRIDVHALKRSRVFAILAGT